MRKKSSVLSASTGGGYATRTAPVAPIYSPSRMYSALTSMTKRDEIVANQMSIKRQRTIEGGVVMTGPGVFNQPTLSGCFSTKKRTATVCALLNQKYLLQKT